MSSEVTSEDLSVIAQLVLFWKEVPGHRHISKEILVEMVRGDLSGFKKSLDSMFTEAVRQMLAFCKEGNPKNKKQTIRDHCLYLAKLIEKMELLDSIKPQE